MEPFSHLISPLPCQGAVRLSAPPVSGMHTGLRLHSVLRSLLLTGLLLTGLAKENDLKAQISAVSADFVDTLHFNEGRPELISYPLFVFNQQTPESGNLNASHPDGGSYDFEWRSYDPALPGFGAVFHSESGVSTSRIQDLTDGAYSVQITDAMGTDTTMLAWVFLNRLDVLIEKDAMGELPSYRYTCTFISVSGQVTPDTLHYYDPLSNAPMPPLITDFQYEWDTDNDEFSFPFSSERLETGSYFPPYEDTEIYLNASDQYGYLAGDTVFYESIQTKAVFSVRYFDKYSKLIDRQSGEYENDSVYWDESLTEGWSVDKGSTDAGLEVEFMNESRNGYSYEWVFLDTLGGYKEFEFTDDDDSKAFFTYYNADKLYEPYLVSTSEANCIDTAFLEGGILLAPSQLIIPNVFSPNGDDRNDWWHFKHQSIKSFRVTVTDRNGKVVYKYRKDPSDIYEWLGWNGTILNSEREAAAGAYYYVVEAEGYDGEKYKDPTWFEQWRDGQKDNNPGSPGTGGPGTEPGNTVQTIYTGWLYLYREVNYDF